MKYVTQLQKENVTLIDCQLHTNHLASLGATMIDRKLFCKILKEDAFIADFSIK
ncbi:MAG TPA: hypothetical protein PK987_12145 [Ferruginibacter sp.]|nr:hypothetical protein [Ferruginibacter sp.]